ncbi:MamI family restriction endonuclease [Mucilaginibacter rigui]|uniref:MamI family restriction endonuclease n=1 Tax=Mucilaginibacter rigui TaxID=534635 RepID=A0ABR7WZ65_9SPHI|nr:MamI family restriction endonuclease [Mucilaginibacter rigui]MBD1383646.1 MamI family restriction endonuclease [Mucilaginibacter rigui]
MVPNKKLITIDDNKNKILKLLQDLVLQPRLKALEWSKVTKQTPNMKIGYPGQHLASLITGVEGARTGARGDDLRDGTEVKSCSRVDQLDTCKYCGAKVLRIETNCPQCDSTNIKRMDDSKWLFGIRSETELSLLTETIDRVFLTLADYPNFRSNDFDKVRFQAFEIWNNNDRHKHFKTLMTNYYNKIFLEHIKRNPNKTPAPKNFWPYSYQFYLCNPVKVFNCVVTNANSNPEIVIDHYIEPATDRATIQAESMPSSLLLPTELTKLIEEAPKEIIEPQITNGYTYNDVQNIIRQLRLDKERLLQSIPFINEETRNYLKLRDTDIVAEANAIYSRRRETL